MFPVLARRLHVACLYLAYHFGFPKLAGGGDREGEGWLTCAARLLPTIGWLLAGYLVKMTLTSVMPRTKSQTLLYHVKCLLAYLNVTSCLLSRKVVTTESVTGGFMHPKLCLLIL
jgi:hypothetical protein